MEKSTFIRLRISPEDKGRMRKLAVAEGISVAELVRRRVLGDVVVNPSENLVAKEMPTTPGHHPRCECYLCGQRRLASASR